MKPAGALVSGYIQFTMAGAVERRSEFGRQSWDAAGDENSVLFTKTEQPYFEHLRDAVEKAIAAIQRSAHNPAPQPPDLASQLRSLAELRDAGILSEVEFQQKKAELLTRM